MSCAWHTDRRGRVALLGVSISQDQRRLLAAVGDLVVMFDGRIRQVGERPTRSVGAWRLGAMPIQLPAEMDPDDLTDEHLATSSFLSSQSSSRYATGGPTTMGAANAKRCSRR